MIFAAFSKSLKSGGSGNQTADEEKHRKRYIGIRNSFAVGERVSNLQWMFNIREGFSLKDDVRPKRIRSVPGFGAYSEEERCAITKEANQSINTRSAEVHENAAQTNTNTHMYRGISQSVEPRQLKIPQASDNIELN